MFMVGGGILTHSLPWLLSTVEALAALSLPGLTLAVFVYTASLRQRPVTTVHMKNRILHANRNRQAT